MYWNCVGDDVCCMTTRQRDWRHCSDHVYIRAVRQPRLSSMTDERERQSMTLSVTRSPRPSARRPRATAVGRWSRWSREAAARNCSRAERRRLPRTGASGSQADSQRLKPMWWRQLQTMLSERDEAGDDWSLQRRTCQRCHSHRSHASVF